MDRWVDPRLLAAVLGVVAVAGLLWALPPLDPTADRPSTGGAESGADGPAFTVVCGPTGDEGDEGAFDGVFLTAFYVGDDPLATAEDDVVSVAVVAPAEDERATFDTPVRDGNATSLFLETAPTRVLVVAETDNGSERRLQATSEPCERSALAGASPSPDRRHGAAGERPVRYDRERDTTLIPGSGIAGGA